MATTVTVRSGEELRQLKVRATDADTIGQIVARVLESQSQRSFLEQSSASPPGRNDTPLRKIPS